VQDGGHRAQDARRKAHDARRRVQDAGYWLRLRPLIHSIAGKKLLSA